MYIHLNICNETIDVKLLVFDSNTWNHSTDFEQMSYSTKNYSY